jgi:hypothetical protein
MSQILNLAHVCRYGATDVITSLRPQIPGDIDSLRSLVLKPIKVFAELASQIEKFHPHPEIRFLSIFSKEAKTTIDATFGFFDLLHTAVKIPKALWSLNIKSLLTTVSLSLFSLKDVQDVFRKCVLDLPLRPPVSLFSRLLQWEIPSQLLLGLGLGGGSLKVWSHYVQIKNWTQTVQAVKDGDVNRAASEDITHAFKIAETITYTAYTLLKVFGGPSKAAGWAKVGLLATSAGFNIMALFSKPSKVAKPFGPSEWKRYFDLNVQDTALPSEIHKILASPCPFFRGKTVAETHLLTLVPEGMTLEKLQTLVSNPIRGERTGFRYIGEEVKKQYYTTSSGRAHWVLMTKGVIPESSNKTWEEHQNMANNYQKQGYKLLSLIDGAVCLLLEYVQTGQSSYPNEPNVSTVCADTCSLVGGAPLPCNIGSFDSKGLWVSQGSLSAFPDKGLSLARSFS